MDKEQIASIIGEKIKQYRLKNGWTQQELGSKIGISKNAIGNYEKGIRSPKKDTMFDLASAFKISIDDLFPQIKKDSSTANPLPKTPDLLTQKIIDTVVQLTTHNKKIVLRTSEELLEGQEREINEELFEYHVFEKLSAGTGYGYAEERNYDTVYFDKNIPHDLASWVYGDSMEPDFADGSVALIKDTGWDYDGAIYAVDWDGQSYIKKVYKEKDGLRLVSLNDKYDDKFARWEEEPRIIGKVVGNFMPQEK